MSLGGDAPVDPPRYEGVRTLIMDAENHQVAWLDTPIWPPIGTVIELGHPNRDAVVVGVRLSLPQAPIPEGSVVPRHGGAVVYVFVELGDESDIIPRDVGERLLSEEGHDS